MEVEPTYREDTQQLIQDYSLKFEDWHQSHLYQRPCEKLAQRHCSTSSPLILLYLIMIWPNTKKCAFTARHQVTNPSRKFVPVSENEGVDGRPFKSPLLQQPRFRRRYIYAALMVYGSATMYARALFRAKSFYISQTTRIFQKWVIW